MKYRTKLYFAFIFMSVIVPILGILLTYYSMKPRIFRNLQTKTVTVAATTAALIDAEALKQVSKAEDIALPAYALVKKQLLHARDANRRHGILVQDIYTFRSNPGGLDNDVVYLVDAEENPEKVSLPGTIDVNEINTHILRHSLEYYSPDTFIEDFGTWVSGFAPVYDINGNYVATVGVDISSARYLLYLHRLRLTMLVGFSASFAFAILGAAFISNTVTKSLRVLIHSSREIGRGNLECETHLKSRDEFQELAEEMNHMVTGLRERERLKLNFARYVSHQVMEKVMGSEEGALLKGEEKKITVLVSDIRQFTHIAEHLPPENVVSLLNEYFEVMLEAIARYQGRLDKFIGDGILVEFGAPFDDPLQEKHAVMAAIDMQKALKSLRDKWSTQDKPLFEMGVGIYTGLAIVGNIGTEKRLEYTAIGDTVNGAMALEAATKHFKHPILVNEATYLAIKDEFKTVNLGPYPLLDHGVEVTVYSVEVT